MKRFMARLVPVIAVAAAVPAFAAISSPAQAADGTCLTSDEWTYDPATYSDVFNASIGCNGVWVFNSYTKNLTVKGQYYKDGTWTNSTLTAKKVTPTATQQQVIGQTVDGRRLRGHKTAGAVDFVKYKY